MNTDNLDLGFGWMYDLKVTRHGRRVASKIFINYRRDDTAATAGRLHDALEQAFGRDDLFMDVDSIPPGEEFAEYLKSKVDKCDIFLCIIGPNWLDVKSEGGERRLDNPDDYVRIEIGAALARKIRAIPVIVDGAKLPKAADLPDDLRSLVRRNAFELRNSRFRRDVDALIEELRQLNSDAEPTKRAATNLNERKSATVAHSNPELDRTLEHSYWVALGDSADFSDYAEFLERFPSGIYAPLARKRFEAAIAKAPREPIERFLHERPISSFAAPLRARLATIEWANLGQERSAGKLRAFIERHFDSVEAGQAKTELAKIEWKRLSQSEDVAEINRILPDLGISPEADLARRRRDALKLEIEQWDDAVAANSVTSFQTYLTKFPRGKHSSDAKQRLNAAEIVSTRQRQVKLETSSEPAKGRGLSWLFGDVGRKVFVATVLVLALAGAAAFWLRSTPNLAPSQESSQSPSASSINPQAGDRVQAPPHESDVATAPNSERIGQAGQAQQQRDQPKVQEAVAPGRVVLYEEDPNDSNGKRYTGTVVWSLENEPAGPGQPMDKAIRGDISIPERNMTVTFTIRRNTDKDLPSSHTVSINASLPADFSHGGIQEIRGLLMKQGESTRGVALAGLSVKVKTGFFLIGLSATEGDVQRNISMLKERNWFDIAIVYNDNRRAILAVEKGLQGDRVFSDAFGAWRQ
jgi:hypothetical protein